MGELDDLRESVAGTRSTVKSLIRTARGALGMLTDLERRLAALEETQSQEAEREQHSEHHGGAESVREYVTLAG